MSESFTYVIVGGGLAGGSAVEGIREVDKAGSILLVAKEKHLPYDRPPLSKKLWFGKKQVKEIFLHDAEFYEANGVTVKTGVEVRTIDNDSKTVELSNGTSCQYDRLLLGTGGVPRKLTVPGGDLEGVCYYRYLDDYLAVRRKAVEGASAVVIGGGFIGSEMTAALALNNVRATMVFAEPYLIQRILPEGLGRAIQEDYIRRGVEVLSGDLPESFQSRDGRFVTTTKNGRTLESDIVIVGVGILPDLRLAEQLGLVISNGIDVNDRLQTSDPDIYAAGDNAFFPYAALGKKTRVEHWDNAIMQGKQAGRNMAGARESYIHMPYFFSDLFDFGFEAVGDTDARLETFADWQKENETGVVYYLQEDRVRGAMMCNVWEKVDAAREMIRSGRVVSHEELKGAIS